MSIWQRFEKIVSAGLDTSKEALDRANHKAQELGEIGVLRYDIMQLERQSARQVARLGTQVFELLGEKGQATVSKNSPGVREVLSELSDMQERIEKKEGELAGLNDKQIQQKEA